MCAATPLAGPVAVLCNLFIALLVLLVALIRPGYCMRSLAAVSPFPHRLSDVLSVSGGISLARSADGGQGVSLPPPMRTADPADGSMTERAREQGSRIEHRRVGQAEQPTRIREKVMVGARDAALHGAPRPTLPASSFCSRLRRGRSRHLLRRRLKRRRLIVVLPGLRAGCASLVAMVASTRAAAAAVISLAVVNSPAPVARSRGAPVAGGRRRAHSPGPARRTPDILYNKDRRTDNRRTWRSG